jgi:hypothetical protein
MRLCQVFRELKKTSTRKQYYVIYPGRVLRMPIRNTIKPRNRDDETTSCFHALIVLIKIQSKNTKNHLQKKNSNGIQV